MPGWNLKQGDITEYRVSEDCKGQTMRLTIK